MSSKPLVLVDPITFKVDVIDDPNPWEHYTRRFLDDVAKELTETQRGKSDIERLKIVNDKLVDKLPDSEWNKLPSDSRFPGFFSSLADHAISTSTVGVALAMECLTRGVNFAAQYPDKELEKILIDKAGLVEAVRLACLLHDAGKPLENHAAQTRLIVENFLVQLGFGSLAFELAEVASKHHYGKDTPLSLQPGTKFEWVVAYADKIAVQDRSFTVKNLPNLRLPLEWLHRHVKVSDIEKAQRLLEFIDISKPSSLNFTSPIFHEVRDIIPLDHAYEQKLDSALLTASENLGVNAKLSMLLLEGEGIQRFIRRSEASRYLAGSSSLIEVATKFVKSKIANILAPESVIYSASGNLLALTPSSIVDKIVDEAQKEFREVVEGGVRLKGPSNFEHVSFDLFHLKHGPESAWINNEEMLSKIEKRSFGELYNIALNTLESLGFSEETQASLRTGEMCTICFEEGARPEGDPVLLEVRNHLPEEEREGFMAGILCLRVYDHAHKLRSQLEKFLVLKVDEKVEINPFGQASIDAEVKSSPLHRFSNILRNHLEAELYVRKDLLEGLKGKTFVFKPVKSWNFLGKQSLEAVGIKPKEGVFDIAFIKGDGDNFGLLKSSMTNITLYRKVSKMFVDVIQGSLGAALARVLTAQLHLTLKNVEEERPYTELELPFEILYTGGDDFMLVLDAGWIFIFLEEFRKQVITKFGSRIKNEYSKKDDRGLSTMPLGISLGVAIVPNRAPIYATLESLDELLKRAKTRSKRAQRIREKEAVFGAEICVALQRFTSLPSETFVRENYDKTSFTDMIEVYGTGWPRLGFEIFDKTLPDGKLGLIEFTRNLLDVKLTANNVARAASVEKMSGKEAILRIQYKAARMPEQRPERKGYLLLAENLMMSEDEKGVTKLKFQHMDVAEVMKIVHEKQSLLSW